MIPLIKRLLNSFLHDEGAVTGWIRGAMLTFGASGLAFADQIGAIIDAPKAVKFIKITSAVCFFIGGAIRAGEKNIITQEPGKPIATGAEEQVAVTKTPTEADNVATTPTP
jgi:hypothetical protein